MADQLVEIINAVRARLRAFNDAAGIGQGFAESIVPTSKTAVVSWTKSAYPAGIVEICQEPELSLHLKVRESEDVAAYAEFTGSPHTLTFLLPGAGDRPVSSMADLVDPKLTPFLNYVVTRRA